MTALLYPALALSLALGGCATARPDAPDLTIPGSDVDRGVPYTGPGAMHAVSLADTVRVGLGESVTVDGVAVRFARVVEDSRCPPDVSCVWAGRAHIELVVAGETHVLSVPGYGPDDQPTEATTGGLTVRTTGMAGPAPSARPAGEAAPVWIEVVAQPTAGASGR